MATELIDREALRKSRETVAEETIRNLNTFKDLVGGDFIGTHGRKGRIVPMGNANYLRYLAYITTHRYPRNHFLTEEDARKEGLSVKEGREPLIIENWTLDKDGKYHCFELPLYSVSDLDRPAEVLDAYSPENLPSLRQPSRKALEKLYEEAGVLPKDAPADRQALYQATFAYASKAVPDNPLVQKHLIHLITRTVDFRPRNLHDHIYTEEDIQHLRENPGLLFPSFSAASKEMRRINQELREFDHQAEQERSAYLNELKEEEKTHPLVSLRVTYHYSEYAGEFTDKDGKPLPSGENIELVGEDAYRFLAQANHADKKYFHHDNYGKTEFAIALGDTAIEPTYCELGDLSFGNRKSVAEAMERQTTRDYEELLQDEARLQSHYKATVKYHPAEAKDKPEYATLKAYRQHLEGKVKALHAFWQDFAKKEQAFLKEHPEYEAINQEDAKPFLAVCPASQLEAVQKTGKVLEVLPKDTLQDFATFQPGEWNIQQALFVSVHYDELKNGLEGHELADQCKPIDYAKHEALPESLVAFTTSSRPDFDEFAYKGFPDVRFVIPKEDLEHLLDFQDFTFQSRSYNPSRELASDGWREDHFGINALQHFHNAVHTDDRRYMDALHEQIYFPGSAPKVELALYAKNEKVFSMDYQEGRGDLAKAVPNCTPALPEKYQEAYDTYCRYSRHEDFPTCASRPADEFTQSFPTLEESRKNFLTYMREVGEEPLFRKPEKTKTATPEWRKEATQYYTNYALLDPAVDTPQKAVLGTIREMAKDGYTEARIKSVITNTRPEKAAEAVAILKSAEGKEAIHKARRERASEKAAAKANASR